VGPRYDPAELRERTRSRLALLLAGVVVALALLLVVFTATDLLSSNQAKDLAAAVLSPVIAVTGTALGFYFGGRSSNGS
jgi:formate/nitrite transporter FocA (FNT family)